MSHRENSITYSGFSEGDRTNSPGELSNLEAQTNGLRGYGRQCLVDWRRTFGISPKAGTNSQDDQLDFSEPLYQSSPLAMPMPTEQPSLRSRYSFQPVSYTNDLYFRNEPGPRPVNDFSGSQQPQAVTIREPMSAIRAIVARVKGQNVISPQDAAALNGALAQLGVAEAECRSLHNWRELAFINRVRAILGSYLARSVPGAETASAVEPHPRALKNVGEVAQMRSLSPDSRVDRRVSAEVDGAGRISQNEFVTQPLEGGRLADSADAGELVSPTQERFSVDSTNRLDGGEQAGELMWRKK